MSFATPFPMSVDAFLDWERKQELRHEFDGVRVFAMNGGSLNHSRIATNIVRALDQRIRRPCEAWRGDVKVRTAAGVRYPDVVVGCSATNGQSDIVPDPVIVFEVIPPTTASVDRLVKNAEYRAIPSVRHCVLVEQNRKGVTVFSRDDGRWTSLILIGDAMLSLPEIGADIPLSELYQNVEWPDGEQDD